MNAEIHIVATIAKDREAEFRTKICTEFPTAALECYSENEFEYRGILKVWELGQIHDSPDDIILYFHSKGVTHHSSYSANANDAYNIILREFDKVREIFTIFPTIDKVGYSAGGNGWLWYNFWYVRGSYIAMCEKPILTQRRHYYEDWLGRKVATQEDRVSTVERPMAYYENTLAACYSFYTNGAIGNIGSVYDPATNRYSSIGAQPAGTQRPSQRPPIRFGLRK
jgi:hypothetical protein